jgi:serine/threonine/tyrosine protein kinase RAD53
MPLPGLVVKEVINVGSPVALESFAREEHALEHWHHPGIVRFFGAWRAPNGARLLVLEAADGVGDGPLRIGAKDEAEASRGEFWRYIATRNCEPEERVKFLAWQMLNAVAFLHSKGVAHRDLKPENMLVFGPAPGVLTSAGRVPTVKISDFGTTRSVPVENQIGLIEANDRLMTVATVNEDAWSTRYVGSTQYIAPEIFRGEDSARRSGGASPPLPRSLRAVYDTKADVYSLGVTLFHVASKRNPLGGLTPDIFGSVMPDVKQKTLAGEVHWELLRPRLSPEGQDLVRRMMHVNPKLRLTAAAALQHKWLDSVRDEARRLFGDERALVAAAESTTNSAWWGWRPW